MRLQGVEPIRNESEEQRNMRLKDKERQNYKRKRV